MQSINPLSYNYQHPDGMNGLRDRIRTTVRKLFSASTGASRLVEHAVTGDIRNFRLFDDQSVADSFKEHLIGQGVAATAVVAAMIPGTIPGTPSGVRPQQPTYTPTPPTIPTQPFQLDPVDQSYIMSNPPSEPNTAAVGGLLFLMLAGTAYYIYQNN